MLLRLREWLQMDGPLGYALAARVWQIISGPISIILMLRAFNESEQGVYSTMVGLVGLQNFFELGYLNLLISHTGRAAAGLNASTRLDIHHPISMDEEALPRVASLQQAATRWFLLVSSLFFLTALMVGSWVLSQTRHPIAWQIPFLCYIALATFVFFYSHRLAILEGLGDRVSVYRVQLFQSMTGTLVFWSCLLSGCKLWTLVLSTLVQLLWILHLFYVKRPEVLRRVLSVPSSQQPKEKPDLLRSQWNTAMYSLAFFLATQLFVVLIMRFHGEEEAGRIGLTLAVTHAIQIVAATWLQTKYSLATQHHNAGRRDQAGTIWRRAVVVSTAILLVLLFDVIVFLIVLRHFFPEIRNRFLSPTELSIYAIGCLANHGFIAQNLYVMARRSNPLTAPSTLGFLALTFAVVLGSYFGSNFGLVVCYTLTYLLFTLPLHTWSYLKLRKSWSLES